MKFKLPSNIALAIIMAVVIWASIFFSIVTIEDNQRVNAVAIKQYIACLITPGVLNPSDTTAQLKLAEQQCFDYAPKVK